MRGRNTKKQQQEL